MSSHRFELRRGANTFNGRITFRDKANNLKVTMVSRRWEALGRPDSVWVNVEVEGEISAIQ